MCTYIIFMTIIGAIYKLFAITPVELDIEVFVGSSLSQVDQIWYLFLTNNIKPPPI